MSLLSPPLHLMLLYKIGTPLPALVNPVVRAVAPMKIYIGEWKDGLKVLARSIAEKISCKKFV